MNEKNEATQKKPFYKRPWFIILAVILVIGGLGYAIEQKTSQQENKSQAEATAKTEKPKITHEYQPCTADELFNALETNALNAKNTYDEQYIELSGVLRTIDSDGASFWVGSNDEFSFRTVTCRIKKAEQKDIIAGYAIDDPIIVRGKITDVGDILGYYMDVDEIVVAE